MRSTLTQNKARNGVAPSALDVTPAEKCHRCGRTQGRCRPVPLGYFCQRDGLQDDPSGWIRPEPDPVAEAMAVDPTVLTAQMELNLAQEAYDGAHQSWTDTMAGLAEARIMGWKVGVFMPAGGGHQGPSLRDRRRDEKLIEAEVEAREARERAGEDLVKARIRHHDAQVLARRTLS